MSGADKAISGGQPPRPSSAWPCSLPVRGRGSPGRSAPTLQAARHTDASRLRSPERRRLARRITLRRERSGARAQVRGNWCMTEPLEVRAELVNLRVPAADCERPLMPNRGRSASAYLCATQHDHSLEITMLDAPNPANEAKDTAGHDVIVPARAARGLANGDSSLEARAAALTGRQRLAHPERDGSAVRCQLTIRTLLPPGRAEPPWRP